MVSISISVHSHVFVTLHGVCTFVSERCECELVSEQ